MNKQTHRLLALMLPAILVGCGQKGPLTLPTPQFPAPTDSAPSTPEKPKP